MFPELTVDILQNLIMENLSLCPAAKRIGLIGSYARGQQKKNSDVDLIIDADNLDYREILSAFGMHVSDILDYRFNKRLEIVKYRLAKKRANEKPDSDLNWYYQEGYQQMLNEVKWIYERPSDFGEDKKLSCSRAEIL
ncbi:MAG: nucleotidyltransferase domain-containing protein [Defluviitaleaceae bacterium]|nr:nucleotidyltransferase domain-containing protein [Defluviitaleaceae bacterium]